MEKKKHRKLPAIICFIVLVLSVWAVSSAPEMEAAYNEETQIVKDEETTKGEYYDDLDNDEKIIYEEILEGIKKRKPIIKNFSLKFTEKTAEKVIRYIIHDNPSLERWKKYSINETEPEKYVGSIEFDYGSGEKWEDNVTDNVVSYYYNALTKEKEKKAYNMILNAVTTFTPTITDLGVDVKTVARLVDFVMYDHPEIFWYSAYAYSYNDSKIVTKMDFVYSVDNKTAKEYMKQIEKNKAEFTSGVSDSMSQYDIALTLYNNIINRIDYDSITFEKCEKDENYYEGKVAAVYSIYGVFVDKKAVCDGYAKAYQYLLNSYGIQCTRVISKTHAWNLVKLDDEYYYIDSTWGDHSNTKKELNTSDKVDYSYFCITSADLEKIEQHKPIYPQYLPECKSRKLNYYVVNKRYIKEYNEEKFLSLCKKAAKDNKVPIAFRCATDEVYNACVKCLDKKADKVREAISREKYSYQYDEKLGTITILND